MSVSQLDEWLSWRRQGVGASDVGGLLGLSPWASQYTVWLDKTGQRADEDNEAMEAGRMLEPAIGPWFTERTGLHVAGEQTWCTHPEHDWARATVDGFVFEARQDRIETTRADDPERTYISGGDPADALGGLEIKTTSEPVSKWEDDGIPPMYAAQGQWQMFVTGMERTWFAVLHANFGLKLRIYELERDEADIAVILATAQRFWHAHVLAGVPPALDGHPATTEALKGTEVDEDEPPVDLDADPAVSHALLERARIKKSLDALTTELDAHENTIRAALGSATVGKSEFVKSITWRPQTSTRVDAKALRERLPRVAARFSNTTVSRVLRVVAHKETA